MVLPFMLPGSWWSWGWWFLRAITEPSTTGWLRSSRAAGWRFTGALRLLGIILAHVFYNFTFCLRLTGEAWERINLLSTRLPPYWAPGLFIPGAGSPCPYWRPPCFTSSSWSFSIPSSSFTVVLVLGGYLYKTSLRS